MVVAVTTSLALSGCATNGLRPSGVTQGWGHDLITGNTDPCSNFYKELITIGGGVLGGVIGSKLGDQKLGAIVAGTVVGGVVGNLIGESIDRRRCELAKIAKKHQLDIEAQPIGSDGTPVIAKIGETPQDSIGMVVSVSDPGDQGGHFLPNSDQLTPQAQAYFAEIAEVFKIKADKDADSKALKEALANRRLLLIGHTDDTGASKFNVELSERRARAVARFLKKHGVPENAIFYQGAGESMPIADNRTEEGRAKNRRVEIIEFQDDAAFEKFLASRKPRYEYYRPQPYSKEQIAAATTKSGSVSKASAAKQPELSQNLASGSQISESDPAAQAKPRKRSGSKASSDGTIDFGGEPLADRLQTAKFGALIREEGFFAIKSAYADDAAAFMSCNRDRPRYAGAVKALKDGKPFRTAEAYPGLYGRTWAEMVNGHLVVVNNVVVLRDGAVPVTQPTVRVYKNYNPAVNRNPTPDIDMVADVNTYRGAEALLYRVFVNSPSGLLCMDIVFPKKAEGVAKGGELVYLKAGDYYGADYVPKLAN